MRAEIIIDESIKERAQKKKKAKKAVMSIFAVIIGFILLYYAITFILGLILKKDPVNQKDQQYIFWEADFDEDITRDIEYMELDRSIYFTDTAMGMTSNSPDDIPQTCRDYVNVISDYIESAIIGDSVKLNNLFSEKFFELGGEEKTEFTPQKIYNINITSSEFTSVLEGQETYPSYTFWVTYMIRHNNGTFRNDMGSDCTRKELFQVTKRGEDYKIDTISVFKTVPTGKESDINCGSCTVSVAAVMPLILSTCILLQKNKKYKILPLTRKKFF